MPGKIIKPVFPDTNTKCETFTLDTDAISALKAARELEVSRESAMKSEKWKRKKEAIKEGLKAQRHRSQTVRGWDLQIEVDDGEDIVETDWVADVDSTGRPAVREVPLIDLLKPGKLRTRDMPAHGFEVIVGASSVIALDDQLIPEPEVVEEDWEHLELGDDPNIRSARHAPSYAEVAAT